MNEYPRLDKQFHKYLKVNKIILIANARIVFAGVALTI